jgi:hypothetical protein
MLREFAVFFLISFELLLFLLPDSAIDILLLTLSLKQALHHQEILIISYILAVYRIQVAFTEREIVNGIKKIGLPHAIFPNKAIDLCRKWNVDLFIILKVDQGKCFQMHTQNYYFCGAINGIFPKKDYFCGSF